MVAGSGWCFAAAVSGATMLGSGPCVIYADRFSGNWTFYSIKRSSAFHLATLYFAGHQHVYGKVSAATTAAAAAARIVNFLAPAVRLREFPYCVLLHNMAFIIRLIKYTPCCEFAALFAFACPTHGNTNTWEHTARVLVLTRLRLKLMR